MTGSGSRPARHEAGDRPAERAVGGGSANRRTEDRSAARRSRGGRSASSGIQPARSVAYEVIRAVRTSDAYANLLLPVRIAQAGLSSADAALATELAYGTLRMQGFYDRVIEQAAHRPTSEIDPVVLDLLRMGAHQLLSMRVPSHAAVNETVELARREGSRSAAGFCNAVLRQIDRRDLPAWREQVRQAASGEDDRLAAELSHPAWIIRAFRRALREEGRPDELTALLKADNVAPRVNLVALPGLADPPPAAERNAYSPFGFVLASGDPAAMTGDQDSGFRVQDEGSQLVALSLAHARPSAPGERWLDMCAGPGGKSALLAAEARIRGASLTANEVVPARVRLVRRALGPSAADVELWNLDGRDIGETSPGAFDRVLVDAPCTGLGALRRRPEARWRKSPRDIPALTRLQEQLIDSAVRALKPGGILVYATCSPHLAETRQQVDAALARWAGKLTVLDGAEIIRGIASSPIDLAGPPSGVQLWPHRQGTDAMFVAVLTTRP